MEYVVLWILALFGLWSLLSNVLEGFYSANMEGIFEINLKVCNQEDTIEILLNQLPTGIEPAKPLVCRTSALPVELRTHYSQAQVI